MNEREKKGSEELDRSNYFSYTVRAGKRIYYLDVKKDRRDELYLTITEIKKVFYGEWCDSQTVFEKHKIFLYKEDFEKFMGGLQQAIQFIADEQGPIASNYSCENEANEECCVEKEEKGAIKIDIDF